MREGFHLLSKNTIPTPVVFETNSTSTFQDNTYLLVTYGSKNQ